MCTPRADCAPPPAIPACPSEALQHAAAVSCTSDMLQLEREQAHADGSAVRCEYALRRSAGSSVALHAYQGAGEPTCTPLETPGVPGGGRLSPLPWPGMNGPRPLNQDIWHSTIKQQLLLLPCIGGAYVHHG